MKILYFDCISGISGDMILGAFIDMGTDVDELKRDLDKLGIGQFSFSVKKVIRNGISVTSLDVETEEGTHHRNYNTIKKIIDESMLSARVKELSNKVFYRLAAAEGKVHSKPVDKVHFHEVGAVDSIVDIVGACICIDRFNIEKIYSSPLKLGSGVVNSAHGVIPVPAPATVELVKDYPVVKTSVKSELTTPTGAAIVTALSDGVVDEISFTSYNCGYGAGSKEIEEVPNILRIFLGETDSTLEYDEVMLVEVNIDDMNPELYSFIFDKLFDNGALDVFVTPVIMKKGRPGNVLSVLCEKGNLREISSILFQETTTIGLRTSVVNRLKLKREVIEIDTKFGKMKAKKVIFNNKVKIVPEYDECRNIAESRNIPLIDIYKMVQESI